MVSGLLRQFWTGWRQRLTACIDLACHGISSKAPVVSDSGRVLLSIPRLSCFRPRKKASIIVAVENWTVVQRYVEMYDLLQQCYNATAKWNLVEQVYIPRNRAAWGTETASYGVSHSTNGPLLGHGDGKPPRSIPPFNGITQNNAPVLGRHHGTTKIRRKPPAPPTTSPGPGRTFPYDSSDHVPAGAQP
ncbi:hypothetical protein LZ30DRAFT_772829 [Colletotrichum cereale]|nr:hypothetical protein LZ30DRAFT_772829 [Colletotrichum cereale]